MYFLKPVVCSFFQCTPGHEDGTTILPEPMLDEDVMINTTEMKALIRIRFSSRKREEQNQRQSAVAKGFDGCRFD